MLQLFKNLIVFFFISSTLCAKETDAHVHLSTIYKNSTEQSLTPTRKAFQNITFQGTEKVLNIGSGNGALAAQIAQAVPKGMVIGVDDHKELVDFANSYFLDTPNLYFKHAEYDSFEIERSFDLIVCLNNIEDISNHAQLFKQARTHLSPGGKIILSLSSPSRNSSILDAIATTLKQKKWKGTEVKQKGLTSREMTPEEYRNALFESNFKVVLCEKGKNHTVFKTKKIFIDWVSTWLSEVISIPKECLAELSEDVALTYLSMTSQSSNSQIIFTHSPWEIEAIAK